MLENLASSCEMQPRPHPLLIHPLPISLGPERAGGPLQVAIANRQLQMNLPSGVVSLRTPFWFWGARTFFAGLYVLQSFETIQFIRSTRRVYSTNVRIWITFKNDMVHMIVNLKSESKMKTTKIIQSRDKSSSTIFRASIFQRNLDLNQFASFSDGCGTPFVSLRTPLWFWGARTCFTGLYEVFCFRVLMLQSGICRHGQQNHHINFDSKLKTPLGLEPAIFGLEVHRLIH